MFAQLVYFHPCINAVFIPSRFTVEPLVSVVFVLNFSHDFFQDILDSNDADGSTVFINYNCQMGSLFLQLNQ